MLGISKDAVRVRLHRGTSISGGDNLDQKNDSSGEFHMNRRSLIRGLVATVALAAWPQDTGAVTDPEKIDEVFASSVQYGKRFFDVRPVTEFDEISFSVHCEAYAATFATRLEAFTFVDSLVWEGEKYGFEPLLKYFDVRTYDDRGEQGFDWVDRSEFENADRVRLYKPKDSSIDTSRAFVFRSENTVHVWYFDYHDEIAEKPAIQYMLAAAVTVDDRTGEAERIPDQEVFMSLLPGEEDFNGDTFLLEGERYIRN